MTDVLKYLSLITLCGTAISFVIGLIRWIDQRNRETEQKHYEGFHKMVCLASGTDESGKTVTLTQQIAAIYQLQAFKKYAFASIPVLELMQFELSEKQDKRLNHINKALSETIQALTKKK